MRFVKGGAFAVILLVLGWSTKVSATTVLNVPGPTDGYADFGAAALADSWTQNFSLTNGSISIDVQGLEPSGGTIYFYLTTQLGPTATLGDLVAFTSLDVPFAFDTVTPFSNLNLAPGNYYLVLADYTATSPSTGPDWNYNEASNAQTVPGLVLNSMEEATDLSPFAPASVFQAETLDIDGVMSLSGTEVTVAATPEPSLSLLLALALTACGIARSKLRPRTIGVGERAACSTSGTPTMSA